MINRYSSVVVNRLGWPALAVVAFAAVAYAVPIIIDDVTSTTATNDGVVNAGEYVGASTGINSGFGDVIGANSQLHVDSDAIGALNFGLVSGGGALNDAVVIYLDTQPGGFSTTSGFTDTGDPLRVAISGYNGTNRATLDFAPGFEANYAIAFDANFAGVWELVNGGSHNFVVGANLNPVGNSAAGQWEMNLTLADIALNPGESFDYVVTYLSSGSTWRADEFHGVAAATVPPGNPGTPSTVTLNAGDYNTFNSFQPIVQHQDRSWGLVKSLYR